VVGSSTKTNFIINNAGNVAIGTTTPNANVIFDIWQGNSSTYSASSVAAPRFRIVNANNTDNNSATLEFATHDNTQSALTGATISSIFTSHINLAVSADLAFRTSSAGTIAEKMRITAAGNVGIGTTTPWGMLSLNPNALGANVPAFVVGSSTATRFIITNGGNVGIGTVSPTSLLHVAAGADNVTALTISNGANSRLTIGTDSSANALIRSQNSVDLRLGVGADHLTIKSTGNVGIGSTTPWAKLSVTNTGTGPSFVVEDDTSPDSTPFIVDASGNVGIGTSTPGSLLTLSGSTSEIQVLSTSLNRSARFGVLDGANTIVDNLGGGWTILKAGGVAGLSTSAGGISIGSYAGVTAAPANGMIVSGNVGIGTTTPQWVLNPFSATTPQLSLSSGAGSSQWTMRAINGNLYFATTTLAGTATSTTAQLTINSSGTVIIGDGTGKLTLGTFDPVYTVNGVAYATYAAGMVGIKEEVTGTAEINSPMTAPDGSTGYVHTIDFDTEAVGGDLWLFAQTTQLRKNIDKLVVLLSAEGNTKVWYQVDRASRKVYLLSNSPTRVSYRMTAPRFDHEKWSNLNHDGVAGFLPPSNDIGEFHTSTSTISFGNTQLLVGTTTIAELIATQGSVTPVKPWTSAMNGVSTGLKNAMSVMGEVVVQAYEGAQYFADGIFKRIFAGEIHTDQLCVSDENGETCITKAQLDALIAGAGNSGGGSGGNGGGGNPDTEAPVITIVGNNPAHIYVGDTYADLGATVTDNVDQNLSIILFVDDVEVSQVTIDTSVAGEHTVRYQSTDTAGNVGSATRTVVVDESAP
jgi:hypothetical protein